MNQGPDSTSTAAPPDPGAPANWRDAITTLVATRFAIFEHEMKIAARSAVKTAVQTVIALLALAMSWALGMAALVGAVASASGMQWYHVAAIVAGAHLLIAVVLGALLKSTRPPSFTFTRNEFKKDREWISQQPRRKKSDD
ncbi:MAG: phage holin family protein [Verrucomicrobiota bacterium]